MKGFHFVALAAALALLPTAALAQLPAPGGETLYARLGGIQRIAVFADKLVDAEAADPLLLRSVQFAEAMKTFPAPAVKFLMAGYIAHGTGGTQAYGGPDMAAIARGFEFDPDQMAEEGSLCAQTWRTMGTSEDVVMEFLNWYSDALENATPAALPGTPTVKPNDDSLYARLGGAVTISLISDSFIDKFTKNTGLAGNPVMAKAVSDSDVTVPGLKYLLAEQLCASAGGPYKVSDGSFADARKRSTITDEEWQSAAALLKQTLDDLKVPEQDQEEVIRIVVPT